MREILKLKKETIGFAKAFYIIITAMYFVSLMILSCCADLFPDSHTGFYWFNEVMNCANRILFIGIVVCIFSEKLL